MYVLDEALLVGHYLYSSILGVDEEKQHFVLLVNLADLSTFWICEKRVGWLVGWLLMLETKKTIIMKDLYSFLTLTEYSGVCVGRKYSYLVVSRRMNVVLGEFDGCLW